MTLPGRHIVRGVNIEKHLLVCNRNSAAEVGQFDQQPLAAFWSCVYRKPHPPEADFDFRSPLRLKGIDK